MAIWLMKSEPDVFSIEDLKREGSTEWEGVRNYQARNFMTKEMNVGDTVLFYHSNSNPSGIAGLGRITRGPQIDRTSLDPKSPYFDPKSSLQNPRWMCVEVSFVEQFDSVISLSDLKGDPQLKDLAVLKKGQRLSILPVKNHHFEIIKAKFKNKLKSGL